jgi:hypothetical protein
MIEKAPSCPACGSTDTRILVFGLAPLISDSTYDLWGCVVPPYAPDYGCKSCSAEWGEGVPPRCLRGTPWTNTDGMPRSTIGRLGARGSASLREPTWRAGTSTTPTSSSGRGRYRRWRFVFGRKSMMRLGNAILTC